MYSSGFDRLVNVIRGLPAEELFEWSKLLFYKMDFMIDKRVVFRRGYVMENIIDDKWACVRIFLRKVDRTELCLFVADIVGLGIYDGYVVCPHGFTSGAYDYADALQGMVQLIDCREFAELCLENNIFTS